MAVCNTHRLVFDSEMKENMPVMDNVVNENTSRLTRIIHEPFVNFIDISRAARNLADTLISSRSLLHHDLIHNDLIPMTSQNAP